MKTLQQIEQIYNEVVEEYSKTKPQTQREVTKRNKVIESLRGYKEILKLGYTERQIRDQLHELKGKLHKIDQGFPIWKANAMDRSKNYQNPLAVYESLYESLYEVKKLKLQIKTLQYILN